MSNLEKFKEKIKLMQEFDDLFNKLDAIYPSTSCFSKVVDKCYLLKDDYVEYVAKEFGVDTDDLFWFIFETQYGVIPASFDGENGETVLIDGVTSFYEWFCPHG